VVVLKLFAPHRTLTVTSERYAHVLQDFFIPRLQGLPVNKTTYFQQDGATSHTAKIAMNISFPDMVTSHGQQDHPAYRCVIFTCGATLRVWCIVHQHLAQLKN
jgi:hypothetical protein